MVSHNQTLALNSIKEHGDKSGWETETQLIVICQFVSENNLDEKLEKYLGKMGNAN